MLRPENYVLSVHGRIILDNNQCDNCRNDGDLGSYARREYYYLCIFSLLYAGVLVRPDTA